MLQLVADALTLCFAGTGTGGQYNQGGQGYGQDSTTGEQSVIHFRPALEALDGKAPLSVWAAPSCWYAVDKELDASQLAQSQHVAAGG